MKREFPDIFSRFCHRGNFKEALPYGRGHINDTYLVETEEKDEPNYILQRINKDIFSDPARLMENIALVTTHIARKTSSEKDSRKRGLSLISTKDGSFFTGDEKGDFWRLYLCISPARSYDVVPDSRAAREGGRAFGRFLNLLSDLPGERLHETIPRFHDMASRLEALENAVAADRKGRAPSLWEEIRFARDRKREMSRILDLGREGSIPLRVTHNDTKFNNVLLDGKDRALCVVDLDTVMPGYIHYDFGDMVRTGTNNGEEDEQDRDMVFCRLDLFEGLSEGFLGETARFLTPREKETLHLSGKTMAFIMGVRFLTDYLEGDRYYKTSRPGHNLDRCRAQFKLTRDLEEREEDLKKILSRYL